MVVDEPPLLSGSRRCRGAATVVVEPPPSLLSRRRCCGQRICYISTVTMQTRHVLTKVTDQTPTSPNLDSSLFASNKRYCKPDKSATPFEAQ